jgi:small-conductance mechanosensitive channel
VDGANDGQVIEINRRATRIRERNGDITIIPNSPVAKWRVTNHCLPEKLHPSSTGVDIGLEASFDNVEKAPILAVRKAKNVLDNPPPEVAVQSIQAQGVCYCVSFFVADYADVAAAQSEALKQVLACAPIAELPLGHSLTRVPVVSQPRHGALAAPSEGASLGLAARQRPEPALPAA